MTSVKMDLCFTVPDEWADRFLRADLTTRVALIEVLGTLTGTDGFDLFFGEPTMVRHDDTIK